MALAQSDFSRELDEVRGKIADLTETEEDYDREAEALKKRIGIIEHSQMREGKKSEMISDLADERRQLIEKANEVRDLIIRYCKIAESYILIDNLQSGRISVLQFLVYKKLLDLD